MRIFKTKKLQLNPGLDYKNCKCIGNGIDILTVMKLDTKTFLKTLTLNSNLL